MKYDLIIKCITLSAKNLISQFSLHENDLQIYSGATINEN